MTETRPADEPGIGVATDPIPLDPADLDALSQVTTATLATRLFALGYRNQVLAGLSLVSAAGERMVGPAYTLRCIPAREDLDRLDAFNDYDHPQRFAIENCPTGHVLVIDSRNEGRAASAGHILLTRLQVRGGAGCVTDGTMRDAPSIASLDLPVFSTGSSPMTNLALHHPVDVQRPIGCAGVAIYPGDVMVGDADGVVCIPRHVVADIAGPALEQERLEDWIQAEIAAGASLRGTYPPDAATTARYHRSIGQPGLAVVDQEATES